MAHLHEAAWQHMLKIAADELDCVEGASARAVAALFAIGEGDVSFIYGNDPGIGDGHAEDIRGEIFKGGLAVADRLAVDVPGNVPGFGIDSLVQSGSFHFVAELGAKDFR